MKKIFFIPASKLFKIREIKSYDIDVIIIDLEDAIKVSQIDEFIDSIIKENLIDFYIRVPLYNRNDKLDLQYLQRFVENGYRKFVLPKIDNFNNLNEIFKILKYKDIVCIILIETPFLLVHINEMLDKYGEYIWALGLGSHDFMQIMGAKHDLQNLYYYRQTVLLKSRAYNKVAIDIASMEVRNNFGFEKEVMNGFNMGYDYKFLIHPNQIDMFNNIQFYNQDDLEWALKIKRRIEKVGKKSEFDPIIIDGHIIEKPHLHKVSKILNFFNNE